MFRLQTARDLIEKQQDEALEDLIKQLNQDEKTPPATEGWGETLRELFTFGRERKSLCATRASKGPGLLGKLERDCGTP